MRARTWFKLTAGSIAVIGLVVGLLYLYTERQARASSESAGIAAELLPVGTEYGGRVVEQHVQVGDAVAAGDVLLTIDSSQLEDELKAEADRIEYEAELASLAAAGESGDGSDSAAAAEDPEEAPEVTRTWEVVAESDGTVADIPVAEGGYVGAGGIVADLFAAGSLYVDVTLRVDGEDLPSVTEGAPATVTLPDDTTVRGEVATVRFAQDELGTVMVLEVDSDQLASMAPEGPTTPGTPVHATVEIAPAGMLADLRRAVDRSISGIDL